MSSCRTSVTNENDLNPQTRLCSVAGSPITGRIITTTGKERLEMSYNFKLKLFLDLALIGFFTSTQPHLIDARDTEKGSYSGCGRTENLTVIESFKISLPYSRKTLYPLSIKCNVTAVGSSQCIPSIICTTMDLRESRDCTKDYMEVYDGVGGYDRFCGKEKVVNLKTGGNSRYLFINLVTSSDTKFRRKYKGVQCEVRCNKGKKVLPRSEPPIFEDPNCVCGIGGQEQPLLGRIVNGENAEFLEFPWLVAIVWKGTRAPLCGGSIINNRWILCASHCFVSQNTITPDLVEVLIGAHVLNLTMNPAVTPVNKPLGNLTDFVAYDTNRTPGSIQVPGWELDPVTDEEEGTLRIGVNRILMHPTYTPNFDFDVSLLELEEDIDFETHASIKPICLPKPEDMKNKFENQVPIVAGWGLADEKAGATSRLLQKMEAPILKNEDCRSWVPYFISERMLCAGYKSGVKDACTDDYDLTDYESCILWEWPRDP